MKKYFKVEVKEKISLSSYLEKDESYFKDITISEDIRKIRTEYLISVLGDVTFSQDIYELFIKQFQILGGMYDVRTEPDTFKGIYEITRLYPSLTPLAIDEIWFVYIKDLFEEYELITVLDKCIKTFGKEDETFEIFIDYVEKKSQEHQQRYIEDSLQSDELKECYGEKFTSHIKSLITTKHYTYDEVKRYLPSGELIKKDEQHLIDISTKTRIFFGCCRPVSYTMFDTLLEEKTLDTYPEIPFYYISTGQKECATFTKTEFLDSIKKQKELIKK